MKHRSYVVLPLLLVVMFGLTLAPGLGIVTNSASKVTLVGPSSSHKDPPTSSQVAIVGATGGSTSLNCGSNDANTMQHSSEQPYCLPVSDSAFSAFTFTALGLPLPSLAPYDTVVLNMASPALQCNSANLSSADKTALVSFVTGGGKLLIFDSECSPSVDYTFLPSAVQFSTTNPGASGKSGTATIVDSNTLASTDSSNTQFIDLGPPSPGGTSSGLCVYNGGGYSNNGADCGDSNVIVAKGTGLCQEINEVTPTAGTTVAYSSDGAVGSGFLVYDGLDRDVSMPSHQDITAPSSTGGGVVVKMFLQELQQAWNPSGLNCQVPIPCSSTYCPPPPIVTTTATSTMGSLDLEPTTAPVGYQVQITGQATTGVTNYDQSCSISSPTNPAIINNADPSSGVACVINGDGSTNGNFTGSFTVGNVPPGEYVIEVTACDGNNGCAPSEGDWVQAVLTVQSSPTIEVSPYGVYPGGTVQIIGSGFSLNDNTCNITGHAVGSVISCQISDGQLTALFAVANVPSGYYELQVTGNTGDYANANVGVSAA